MKLSDLIKHVGDDNVTVQNLDDSFVHAKVKKYDGEITFATDTQLVIERLGTKEPTYLGLVVWIPRNLLPDEVKGGPSK